jgi:DedD protein
VASGKYFIQVGSFQQTPSKRFLSIIRNSGFKYIISRPNSKGSKKLLIGPYASKSDATQALITVKSRINKSAYVIHKQ